MKTKAENLSLAKALRLPPTSPPRIAFVGAGGKTGAMFKLARELALCIVTTTTHLGTWQADEADQHIIISESETIKNLLDDIDYAQKNNLTDVILIAGEEKNNRLRSLSPENLTKLKDFCDTHSLPLLIEADGARQKSLKSPKKHEPAIPNFVDTVIVVAGLSGAEKTLSEDTVYNIEGFAKLGMLKKGEKITPDNLAKILKHKEGGLKNIPTRARRIALLNQISTPKLKSIAEKIAQKILPKYDAVISANLSHETHPLQVFENTAAIILAAGSSSRFGEPKQLLDYHGKSFIRTLAENALEANLSPVIIVAGAEHEQIKSSLQGLAVRIVHNTNWKKGQSSSIKAGIKALPTKTASAIFLLADQPQVTSSILRALIKEHQHTLNPVIAPMIEGRRANPVLFDRATFPALLKLQGDIGGRGIFSKFAPSYIEWQDSSLLLDVDRPEDYKKIITLHKLNV